MEVPRAVVVAVAAAPLAAEAMEAGVMEGSRAAVLMVAQVRAEGTLVAVGWKVAETAAENKAEERVEGEMVEEAWVGADMAAKATAVEAWVVALLVTAADAMAVQAETWEVVATAMARKAEEGVAAGVVVDARVGAETAAEAAAARTVAMEAAREEIRVQGGQEAAMAVEVLEEVGRVA